MEKILTNSIVFLSDGQELFCENTIEKIEEELQKNNRVCLILSKQNGQKLYVHEQHVCGYEEYAD